MASLKRLVHNACLEAVQRKINLVKQSMQEAQISANEETKSSAGDKYETSRAMAQLEIEKLSTQLTVLQNQLQELGRIYLLPASSEVAPGSLVHTDAGIFYVATNVGDVLADGKKVFAISPQAPIALKMMGLSPSATLEVNGRSFKIISVE